MENKFELLHVGIKTDDPVKAEETAKLLAMMFNLEVKMGNSSNFASGSIEVMKSNYLGKNGHISVRTNNIAMAMADLEKKGYCVDMDTAKYKGEQLAAVYVAGEFGGFAIHLQQK